MAATIAVSGNLDAEMVAEVVRQARLLERSEIDSIVVELNDVRMGDLQHAHALGRELMLLRGEGLHVQALARDAVLHATLHGIDGARDWLIDYTDADIGTSRRGIHLDRIAES